MRKSGFLGTLLLLVSCVFAENSLAQEKNDSCSTCHLALGIEALTKPAELYKNDIHAAKGFGCVNCHGGDGELMALESMDRKKGYIGKPMGAQIIDICGKCHSDGTF